MEQLEEMVGLLKANRQNNGSELRSAIFTFGAQKKAFNTNLSSLVNNSKTPLVRTLTAVITTKYSMSISLNISSKCEALLGSRSKAETKIVLMQRSGIYHLHTIDSKQKNLL
jgi:hypothetical protein